VENAIYFSKIEYREVVGYGNTASVILLDIPERELSYQVFDCKKQMQAIEERWNKNGCSQIRQRKSETQRLDLNHE